MAEEKKKNKFVSIWLPIIIGLTLGLGIIGGWIAYLVTLPSMSEQLKYSPFSVEGTWRCETEDFVITSKEGEVTATFEKEQKYTLTFTYLSTRGFNHKYAATITIIGTSPDTKYTCYYEFKEEEFVLKNFKHVSGGDPLNGISSLRFLKTSLDKTEN